MSLDTSLPATGLGQPFRRARQFYDSLAEKDGLHARALFLVFALALIVIVLRDISLFRNPQFYAEDGAVWYAQAYNGGWWHSLLNPDGGYLNTLQRLAAGAALLVPFRWAPLVMATAGLLIQALPVPILLSERCRNWSPLPVRMAFAAGYVLLPDAREIHVVCTNSQWHLGLALLFIALAAPPRTVLQKAFDLALLIVAAVSGPFPILSLPIVGAFWIARRQRWTHVALGILAAGSAIQISYLVHNPHVRSCGKLGATPALFVKLLGGNSFLGLLLGSRTYGLLLPLASSLLILLAAIGLCAYCARFAGIEVTLFFVYCFTIFAAGLRSPLICSPIYTQWQALLTQPGQRYSFFPSLAFLFAFLWCAGFARSAPVRAAGCILALVFVCFGVRRDFKIRPAMENWNFPAYAAAFEAAPPGTHMVIPIPPALTMELTKKPR